MTDAVHQITPPDSPWAPPADSRGYDGFAGEVAEFSSQSSPSWPPITKARAGAPNIVVILVDDLGFSDISPYGSEIDTPHLAELAKSGLRFNNYHTTPVCAPSRAALLSGLNPHRAGMGIVPHSDPGYPGYRMELTTDAPTLAESLRAGGYATMMVGKWHLTNETRMHDAADRSSWPVQRGFDKYFGSMDGCTSMYHPHRIVRDNTSIEIDWDDDTYLTDVLTDEALGMIRNVRSNDPEKPFFLYFAHQAVHGPLQAKAVDIEKYRGKYEAGWDAIRADRFAAQLESGLFPEGTEMAPSTPRDTLGVLPWEKLSDEQRELFARHMEVYAASVDAVDQSVGRVVDELRRLGELENTIIVFTSDNGGTGEAGVEGTRSYLSRFLFLAGLPESWVGDVPRNLDLMGGPQVFGHYPRGWGHVSNTPFRRYKGQCHAGGVQVPLIVSWPEGLTTPAGDDGTRTGYTHVTDLYPTLLELAGVERIPTDAEHKVDGVSFAESLRDRSAASKHTSQYVEMAGQRGYYEDGYKLISPLQIRGPVPDDKWELYHVAEDPTETRDIAAENPKLVKKLIDAFTKAAWENTVFPLNDDGSIMTDYPARNAWLSEPLTIYPGSGTLERYRSAQLTSMRSFEVEIDLDYEDGAEGVLLSHGDQGGGYILLVEDGRLNFSYNAYGAMTREVGPALTPGTVPIRVAFNALPELLTDISVIIGGEEVISIPAVPQLLGLAPFAGITVGADLAGPVDWELHQRRRVFRYSSAGLRSARYLPGAATPEKPERLIEIQQVAEAMNE